jgi:hypothetical protein
MKALTTLRSLVPCSGSWGYLSSQNEAGNPFNSTQDQNKHTGNDNAQVTYPTQTSDAATLKEQALWAEPGAAKLQDYIGREPNSELSAKDLSQPIASW